jgi:adenosylhomocysteine nucleosidase
MMKRENRLPCFVFPMGMEAHPFLKRVEVLSRRKLGKAVYREAFFEGQRIVIVRCGIGPHRAAESLRNLDVVPSWIVGVGTAGALVEDLGVGDLVVSESTVWPMGPQGLHASCIHRAELFCQAARRTSTKFRLAKIASMDRAVFDRKEREALHQDTGAVAVDMESYWLSQEAHRLGVPFVALRVISDDMNSPPLPTFTNAKDLLRSPLGMTRLLPAYLRWREFLKGFRQAVNTLPPVLVEALRCSARQRDNQ